MEIKVVSSAKLSSASVQKIEKAFQKKHDGKARFVYDVDPSLIGGILVIDGEKYYDASVRGQLAELKRNLR